MVKMVKFQTSALRIGVLEGTILYRIILVGFIVLLAIYFLGTYGFLSLVLIPVFLLRIQHDYLDEFVVKKVRGITVYTLHQLTNDDCASYEIFGTNYGLSERQDENIIAVWAAIIGSFSEDIIVIRHPYRIPLQKFQKGKKEYDELFNQNDAWADAYFITVSRARAEDLEKTLGNYGIAFSRLSVEQVKALNDAI